MADPIPLSKENALQKLGFELIQNWYGSQAVHETIVAYQANRRAGTHSTLTKAEVNRSGKKPWKQKGTGNARAGYASSPIWRGGGVVFGPKPRDYSKKTSKKVKKLALRKSLSARILLGDVYEIEPPRLDKPKTKDLLQHLAPFFQEDCTALLVLDQVEPSIVLSSRNHPLLEVTTGSDINAEQILRYTKILVTEGALKKIAERLKN